MSSQPVEKMAFGIKVGEKIKFYRMQCKESFFSEKSTIEIVLKSVSKKMHNCHLKN